MSLKSGCDYTSSLHLALDGVEVKTSQAIDNTCRTIVIDFPQRSLGRFLSLSGYMRLSDILAISIVPASLQVE